MTVQDEPRRRWLWQHTRSVPIAALIAVFSWAGLEAQSTIDMAVEVRTPGGRSANAGTLERLRAFVGDREIEAPDTAAASIGPLEPERIVVYLDANGSRADSLQRVVSALIEQVDAGLLPPTTRVEIVRADPVPRTLVAAGSSSAETAAMLAGLSIRREQDLDEVALLRRDYLLQRAGGLEEPSALRRRAMALEVEIRRRELDELILWIAAQGEPSGPRLLFLLNDNLGLGMSEFYAEGGTVPTGLSPLQTVSDKLGRALAVYGWTLVPVVSEPEAEPGRFRYQPTVETPVGFRLSLGRNRRDRQAEEPEVEEVDLGLDDRDLAQLEGLAGQTGGEVLTVLAELPAVIMRFSERTLLRYRSETLFGEVLPLGEVLPFRLEIEGGRTQILAPSFVGRGTPEGVAEARARRAIEGDTTASDLLVRSAIEFDRANIGQELTRYEVTLDLTDRPNRLEGVERATFRVTLGVHLESGEFLLRHELVRDVDLSGQSAWRHEGLLRLPVDTDGAVVLVELLETGDWGESFASFIDRRSTEVAADGQLAGRAIVPSQPVLRLVPPSSEVQLGRISIKTTTGPAVKRVVFLLDGKRVSTRRRAPYDANLDLGSNPRRRLLVAVAYGEGGQELGRDALILNEAARSFNVRIVKPERGRRSGPVEVEAVLRTPPGAVLDRVDFFWRDELVGSSTGPPFRQRLFIPVAADAGLIRVAAHLSDGRIAEDIVLMNADEFGDELTVRLVELYVVVTDRDGKPVLGLERDDFIVREADVVQELEDFSLAGKLRITVGLAIDSSLSLFMRMPAVQSAADAFVRGLQQGQDRAFLVGFGSRPRMVRATTGNLGSVSDGIDSLKPGGTTALWEAIVLSLSQLRESAGRKALVVFYDGDDEDEDYSYGASSKLAEETGIPIYLIVMNNAAARSNGASFGTKSRAGRLERLARAGGGRVFYVRTDQDLNEIFTAVRDELRSHYLLAYYPTRDELGVESDWRPIEIEMRRRGLTARTLAGYGELNRLAVE